MITLLFALSALGSVPAFPETPEVAFKTQLHGRDGCFELYDVTGRRTVKRISGEGIVDACSLRVPPCSTFKVPLAVMAIDRGLIRDAATPFKWDGAHHDIESWNSDQTAESWIQNSVVWVSQELTPRLGEKTVARYLRDFKFGNGDMSAGLTQFWLDSSLKVSADEQIRFWERLVRGLLPVSKRAGQLTLELATVKINTRARQPRKAALPGGPLPDGHSVSGRTAPVYQAKTGSGNPAAPTVVGWYVGHVASEGHDYVFSVNFREKGRPRAAGFAGLEARKMAEELLVELGLL